MYILIHIVLALVLLFKFYLIYRHNLHSQGASGTVAEDQSTELLELEQLKDKRQHNNKH